MRRPVPVLPSLTHFETSKRYSITMSPTSSVLLSCTDRVSNFLRGTSATGQCGFAGCGGTDVPAAAGSVVAAAIAAFLAASASSISL